MSTSTDPLAGLLAAVAGAAAEAVLERLQDIVVNGLRAALAERDAEALLPTAAAARLLGRTPAALRMLARRNAAVAASRIGGGRGARWDRRRLLAALDEAAR